MSYDRMTDDEAWAFLETPIRPAILSTVRGDGRPHSAPIWYAIDNGAVVFNTGAKTVKGRNLVADPRATICVQDERPPFSFVMVEGVAETIDDVDAVRRWATVIGGRYMGADRAEEYGARNGVPGELLIRLVPMRLHGVKNVAD